MAVLLMHGGKADQEALCYVVHIPTFRSKGFFRSLARMLCYMWDLAWWGRAWDYSEAHTV